MEIGEKDTITLLNNELLHYDKHLSIIMAAEIDWKLHNENRCSKALKAFFLMKKKHIGVHNAKIKLRRYAGYLLPIVTHED